MDPELVTKINSYDVNQLLRQHGDYQFTDVEPELKNSLAWLKTLAETTEYWSQLPEPKKTSVNSSVNGMISVYDQIISFDTAQPDPNGARTNIAAAIKSQYNDLYINVVQDLRSYLAESADKKDAGKALLAQLRKQVRDAEKITSDVESSAEAARAAAGTAADTRYAQLFSDESKQHYRTARWWFISTVVITAISLIVYVWVVDYLLHRHKIDFTLDTVIRLLILTIFLYMLRIATKNYSAHMHLGIMNRHRSNVMLTIQAFEQSVKGEGYKDFMYAVGAQAAFSAGETGYLTTREGAGGSDADGLTAQLNELLKSRTP